MGTENKWRVSTTNIYRDEATKAQMSCLEFWEFCQEIALIKVSNRKQGVVLDYKIETNREQRARKIASAYAYIFLESKVDRGTKDLKGRYHWMGLGAFASKTVAALLSKKRTKIPFISRKASIHVAKGNLWLSMDIAPWHFAWNVCPKSFEMCMEERNLGNFKDTQKNIKNIEYEEDVLPKLNYLKTNNYIEKAFIQDLPNIEKVFLNKEIPDKEKYNHAKDDLLSHLTELAYHEQLNILQPIVWEEESVKSGAELQRAPYIGLLAPSATVILSRDYHSDDLTVREPHYSPHYASTGNRLEDKETLNYLKANDLEPIVPIRKGDNEGEEATIVEDGDSRMEWILEDIAGKYHKLMLNHIGRKFLYKELDAIASWYDNP